MAATAQRYCRISGAAALCAAALAVAIGCRRESAPRAPEASAARPEPKAARVDPPRLPEDPLAGKRSEQQWREHLEEEEHERQLGFDRRRLKQHRAVVSLIDAARAQYDRARTEAEVAKVRKAMPKRIAVLRRRVTEIDHWGVNSPMLPEYEALAASLADAYPDAKNAALKGDAQTLAKVRADFDRRMKTISEWLTEAAESKDEYG